MSKQLGCRSIAFPLICAGSYRFPKDEALSIALQEIRSFLDDEEDEEMTVILVVYDKAAYEISVGLSEDVKAYIDDRYVADRSEDDFHWEKAADVYGDADEESASRHSYGRARPSPGGAFAGNRPYNSSYLELRDDVPKMPKLTEASDMIGSFGEYLFEEEEAPKTEHRILYSPSLKADHKLKPGLKPKAEHKLKEEYSLEDLMKRRGENFQECLFRLIDESGMTDVEVYKKANLDRKVFSKIRSNSRYLPKKQTALALAFALELNMDETKDLMGRAGIALSDSNKFDLIIEYCLQKKIYDLIKVNSILFEHDQILLGSR